MNNNAIPVIEVTDIAITSELPVVSMDWMFLYLQIKWGDPVVVHRPHSYAYKPAHIREIVSGRYMIWYDDGSYIYQTKNDIRVFNKSIVCSKY